MYCPFESQAANGSRLEELGAQPTPFYFDLNGLQTWETKPSQANFDLELDK